MKCVKGCESERERVEGQEWGKWLVGGKATEYSTGCRRRELHEAC